MTPQNSGIRIASTRAWSRIARSLPAWLQGKGRAVLGIGILLSAASTAIGVAHLAWPWLAAAGCAGTAIATLATHAIEARKQKEKVQSLWMALAVACAIPVIAFSYHQWWDPARVGVSSYQAIIDGNEVQVFYPYDEPGGTQSYTYAALPADGSVRFSCYVSLPSSGLWFLIANDGGWIPRDAVHAIPGIPFPDPPHCS